MLGGNEVSDLTNTGPKYHQTFSLTVKKIPSYKDTHKVIVFRYQDVHLWALGADDLAVQRVLAQVDMATVRLVDGDSGDLTQDLDTNRQQSACNSCCMKSLIYFCCIWWDKCFCAELPSRFPSAKGLNLITTVIEERHRRNDCVIWTETKPLGGIQISNITLQSAERVCHRRVICLL